MRGASRGLILLILIVSILSATLLVPTFMGDKLPSWWGKIFPDTGIRLGLDLRGGIFLVLGVEAEKAVEYELLTIKNLVVEELKNDKVLIKGFEDNGKTLTIDFFSNKDLDKARQVSQNYQEIANISSSDLSLIFRLKNSYVKEIQKRAIDQVQQVILNRVQEFGLVEPSIQKAGNDRIIIQDPGASQKDRERIIEIIRRSAV